MQKYRVISDNIEWYRIIYNSKDNIEQCIITCNNI